MDNRGILYIVAVESFLHPRVKGVTFKPGAILCAHVLARTTLTQLLNASMIHKLPYGCVEVSSHHQLRFNIS